METIVADGVKWYRAKSVAQLLGYRDTQQIIRVSVDRIKKTTFEELVEVGESHDYKIYELQYL